MFYNTQARTIAASFLLSVSFSAISQTAAAQDSGEIFDEIIVTGSPLGRSLDEAITGVSVLSGDELSDRLASTIGETLKSEPGLSSTFFGAGASRPILRGQGGDRVRVLTNGIGSIDASSASPDHAVAVEPAQAERIEVLRGAALLRYGSLGAGGVVNVIDGRIPDTMPEDGFDATARFGASSADNGVEGAASIDAALGSNFVLHLDGTFKDAGNYDIPGFAESAAFRAAEEAEEHDDDEDDHDDEDGHDEDGHEDEEEAFGSLPNSQTQSHSITGGLSYIGDWGHIGIAVHDFNADYGVPGGHHHEEGEEDGEDHDEDEDHDEEEEEENITIGLDQTRVDLNASIALSGAFEALQIFGGYADYTHTEFEGPGVVGTVFANEGYELRGELIQKEQKGWKAAYGAQIRHRDFSAIGEEAFVPPSKTRQIGLYTFHQKEVGDLHIEGSGRFESTRQTPLAGNSETFNLFSLSAGGDYHVTDAVRIGGTVFRTARAPSTEELFSNGPHLATEQFELGNPDLGKEVATGIEAAIRHKEDGHFITANLFYTDYKDYIFEARTDAVEDGLPVFQFTAADATFRGFELQGGMDIAQWGQFTIKADALGEYVRAKTSSGNLPRIPPLSLLAGIEAASDTLSLRAEVDYTSAQKDVAALESETGDYALTNAFATWTLPTEQDLKLSLSVLNIFDVEARQHTSFLKDLAPLLGRNVRVSMRAAF